MSRHFLNSFHIDNLISLLYNKSMKINEVIIVEGKYDKIKLDSILEGIVIPVGGFSLFKNKEMMKLIRSYAEERGIVVLTDSDSAGFLIRNYLKQCIPNQLIKNAYIPELKGKEKRKAVAGKEGLLGVEGVDPPIIFEALKKAGCCLSESNSSLQKITKTDLYNDGLLGQPDSALRRQKVLAALNLPSKLSSSAFLDALNSFSDYDQYREIVKRIFS